MLLRIPSLNKPAVPHLFDHDLDFPLLAEHHVVQVLDPLAETRGFGLQIFGPKAARRVNVLGGFLTACPGIPQPSRTLAKSILISLSEDISLKCCCLWKLFVLPRGHAGISGVCPLQQVEALFAFLQLHLQLSLFLQNKTDFYWKWNE